MSIHLSKNFILSEFTTSQTAARRGIDNMLSRAVMNNLQRLAIELEVIRDQVLDGCPIIIKGIFKDIQRELGLSDERHSVLELAKGKLTTDPDNHTGEGIFFSSRMFDDFAILSGSVYFSHKHDQVEDWILERQRFQSGTAGIIKSFVSGHESRILLSFWIVNYFII